MKFMNPTTLKCTVRYDGTNFSGWQRQDNQRTVQGEIEAALSKIANRAVTIQGAGRTDAGVHALGQVFSCRWRGTPPQRLAHALSRMLKPEIRIESIEQAAPDFNARFDAVDKSYHYTFDFNRFPDPLLARYAWHMPGTPDLDLLKQCLSQVVGTHDFAGFQSAGNQMKNTVRTIFSADFAPGGLMVAPAMEGVYSMKLRGNGFLYRMVRNLAGTLVEIARGRFGADFITESLLRGGPFLGMCAPAHGLVMVNVNYDTEPPPHRHEIPLHDEMFPSNMDLLG
jgi:tRNA pseudouridine38-40 synthase